MATETIRPTGDSSVALTRSSGSTNYSLVDETVTNDSDYVLNSGAGAYQLDLYTMADSGVGAGTINSVTLYGRCYTLVAYTSSYYKFAVKMGGTTYYGSEFQLSAGETYELKSTTWNTNPNTSAAWTWANINDLIAGIAINTAAKTAARMTQFYIVVDYTEAANTIPVFMNYYQNIMR